MSYLDVQVSPQAQEAARNLLTKSRAAPVRAVLADLPSGRAGAIATLNHMAKFVHDAVRDPQQRIKKFAVEIFREAGIPPRKYAREIRALQRWVHRNIRYTKDPVGLESVQDPLYTIECGTGDCDDQATLLAALLMATGHPSRFKAVGFKGGPLSHVLTQAREGAGWTTLETIVNRPAGWFPSGVTTQYKKDLD